MKLIGTFILVCGLLPAQSSQTRENETRMAAGSLPVYRVNVTERSTKAINYQHRSGATKIDFRGTELLPNARGEAKVESKQGYIEVEVEFDNLQPANTQGAGYLTYVLWAITPEGRTSNLGEILLNGTKSKLNVTTDLQSFGLVVTAEPYFSVTRPSDLIVLENVVRADTRGKIEEIDAKYELLQRGEYERFANPLALKLDRKLPLELYQARNAIQIARAVGAERYANETFLKAEQSLSQAEAYQARKAGKKPVTMTARQAVQTAEDARAIAVKRQEEEALAVERQQSAEREALAESSRVAAQSEADRVKREAETASVRAQAESDRLTREKNMQAEEALAEAARVKRETDARAVAAGIEADRVRVEYDTRMAAAAGEAERRKLESDSRLAAAKAESDSRIAAAKAEGELQQLANESRIATATAETERIRQEYKAQLDANQATLNRAAEEKARADAEKTQLRGQLLKQFDAVLQTQDTARGLIVNMSDVLFDTGKYSLRPVAREKLAKVVGIAAGHPGLKLEVEGHTDSVGGEAYNQRLSEQRGAAVRDYLTQQGMAAASVTTKGMGKTQPVASNDTAQGRQQNRRVEIVISGEVIGTEIGTPLTRR